MLGKCKNCKHWILKQEELKVNGIEFRECNIVESLEERYELYYSSRNIKSDDAYTFGDLYDAPLYTGEEFGCVRFEPKEEREKRRNGS